MLACLVKLVAIYDGFLTCNDGFMGNHSEAYWHLHKAAQREWSEARLAISKALTPQASEDREEGVGS